MALWLLLKSLSATKSFIRGVPFAVSISIIENMQTSWHRNAFRITGHCGGNPRVTGFAILFAGSMDRLLSKRSISRWFQTRCRHRDVTVTTRYTGECRKVFCQTIHAYPTFRLAYIRDQVKTVGLFCYWFCYHLIAKPGNNTSPQSWPDPYIHNKCAVATVTPDFPHIAYITT